MAFAILRTKRIKDSNKIAQAFAHNLRTKYQKNVDQTKSHSNEILIDELDFANAKDFDKGYSEILDDYYSSINVKQKKNSVQMMEFVLTASPDFFKNASPGQLDDWKKEQLKFAKKEFKDNLKFAVLHLDEKTPHLHIMVSVEEKKTVKFKNRYGSGEKEQISLNARRFNRDYLTDLHTRYAEHNKGFGLVRGNKKSKAVHKDLQEFYKDIDIANRADYSKIIDKSMKEFFDEKNALGLQKKYSFNEIVEKIKPILNDIYKKQKKQRTLNKYNSSSVTKEIVEILKTKDAIDLELKETKELRTEYFESVKNYESVKKENTEIKAELRVANTTAQETRMKQLCFMPSWQDNPLAKNCGCSCSP